MERCFAGFDAAVGTRVGTGPGKKVPRVVCLPRDKAADRRAVPDLGPFELCLRGVVDLDDDGEVGVCHVSSREFWVGICRRIRDRGSQRVADGDELVHEAVDGDGRDGIAGWVVVVHARRLKDDGLAACENEGDTAGARGGRRDVEQAADTIDQCADVFGSSAIVADVDEDGLGDRCGGLADGEAKGFKGGSRRGQDIAGGGRGSGLDGDARQLDVVGEDDVGRVRAEFPDLAPPVSVVGWAECRKHGLELADRGGLLDGADGPDGFGEEQLGGGPVLVGHMVVALLGLRCAGDGSRCQ